MSATTRSLAVAVVQSTGTSARQEIEDAGDAAVVGPEVVTPVADAVRLVDHEQPDAGAERGQHVVAEAALSNRSGETSSRSTSSASDVGLDRRPTRRCCRC